ncbi:MAG: hypothetical protein LBN05_08335 [Oscillospiraceae bacterium]|jgi:hypothetical protein|nr:hypothetical protein [Oscillospiraceae bacterium]
MKNTKRILALLMVVLTVLGGVGIVGAVAAPGGVANFLVVEPIAAPAPPEGFTTPGYFYATVKGVFPGNVVTWSVTTESGTIIPVNDDFQPGFASAAGYTITTSIPSGTYRLRVDVVAGSNPNGYFPVPDHFVSAAFVVPDRTELQNALNGDKTVPLDVIWDSKKLKVYQKAKKTAIAAFEALYATQEQLDEQTALYTAALDDLTLKEGWLSEFLWHLFNMITTLFGIVPFADQPQYKLS